MKNPKVYVDVIARFSADGELFPLEIIWEDGRRYAIDRITEIRRASSMKAGGTGIRYGCIINNHRTYVFFEEDRWFVERRHE
ncbi:MAG: hypothetical protein GX193_10750 [Clostridiales bacterium]|nr:hypothetical protein [Clostridiales bacterium]